VQVLNHLPLKIPTVTPEPDKGIVLYYIFILSFFLFLTYSPCTFDIWPSHPAGADGSTRIQLRLADGKTLVRRMMKTDPVSLIYAVVLEQVSKNREEDKIFLFLFSFLYFSSYVRIFP
jgi:hypothetical protein